MIPKFLVGDNTDYDDAVFIVHTEYPRFVINLEDDEVEWFDTLENENEEEATQEVQNLIQQAEEFYQREVDRYEELED
ncbi:MAG: hypothetical protein N4A46_16765 [Schleiferiaceae bacterium]|nr:hypothetical protein [Schleiferiaceae bacterium]